VAAVCSSNSLRVIKTTKQTSEKAVTYPEVVRVRAFSPPYSPRQKQQQQQHSCIRATRQREVSFEVAQLLLLVGQDFAPACFSAGMYQIMCHLFLPVLSAHRSPLTPCISWR
jgi:hypothetical protein